MDSKKLVGLFFGSFNPIHIGHLIIANSMIENGNLDRVWFVVTPKNPLKSGKGLLHEFDRYDLVKLAIADNFRFEVSDVEFNLPKPNYTAQTLAYLSEKYPDKEFILILGEDNLGNFERWKNYKQILKNYKVFVYPRPGATKVDFEHHSHVTKVDAPILDISATFIRNAIRNNKSIQYLVPESADQAIQRKGFYLK